MEKRQFKRILFLTMAVIALLLVNFTKLGLALTIDLAWEKNTEADLKEYRIYYHDDEFNNGSNATDYETVAAAASNEALCTQHGLDNGTIYCTTLEIAGATADEQWFVGIAAVNEDDQESPVSDLVDTFSDDPDDVNPPARPDLELTVDGQTAINLSFSATDDKGVNHYVIYHGGSRLTTSQDGSYRHESLQPGSTHEYYVVAFDRAGHPSPQSETRSATTEVGDTSIPPKVGQPAGEALGSDSIRILWPEVHAAFGIVRYHIYRDGQETAIGTATDTIFEDDGLNANTDYTYRIKAENGDGTISAAFSEPVAVKTQAGNSGDTEDPTWPDNASIDVQNVTTTSLKLVWPAASDNIGVTRYEITCPDLETMGTAETEAEFTGLTADTRYEFSIVAQDGDGNASEAKSVIVYTDAEGSNSGGSSGGGSGGCFILMIGGGPVR